MKILLLSEFLLLYHTFARLSRGFFKKMIVSVFFSAVKANLLRNIRLAWREQTARTVPARFGAKRSDPTAPKHLRKRVTQKHDRYDAEGDPEPLPPGQSFAKQKKCRKG